MIAHAPDAPHGHMFASEPTEWPLLVRSIAYWLSPNSNVRMYPISASSLLLSDNDQKKHFIRYFCSRHKFISLVIW